MNRGKKIVIISHCILNQNSVVELYGKNSLDFFPFVKSCFEKNIGIIQLPCPEFQIYGAKRWGHVKDQFEHGFFKERCKELLAPIVLQIEDYILNNYKIEGVYGIKCSPSCGVSKTCRGDWSGEASSYKDLEGIKNRVKIVDESGVFMDIFKSLLKEKKINLKFLDIDDWSELLD